MFFPVPCCGYMFASATLAPGLRLSLAPYSRSYRMVFVPLSEAPLCALQPPALSFLVVSLRMRFFGSSWISPLCFPVCRYASEATCAVLPHVSGLSFVLGNISFWLGFGRCLIFLFAPCGCRRPYCGPHCGSESARVLSLSHWFFPFRGSTPVSRLFLSLRLMSESLTHSIPRSF